MPCRKYPSFWFTSPWKFLYMASIMTFSIRIVCVWVCEERVYYYIIKFALIWTCHAQASVSASLGEEKLWKERDLIQKPPFLTALYIVTCRKKALLHFTSVVLGLMSCKQTQEGKQEVICSDKQWWYHPASLMTRKSDSKVWQLVIMVPVVLFGVHNELTKHNWLKVLSFVTGVELFMSWVLTNR